MRFILLFVLFIIPPTVTFGYELPEKKRDLLVSQGFSKKQIQDIIDAENAVENRVIKNFLDKFGKTGNPRYIYRIATELDLEVEKGLPIFRRFLDSENSLIRQQSLLCIIALYKGKELESITSDLLKIQTNSVGDEAVLAARCVALMGNLANKPEFVDSLLLKSLSKFSPEVVAANIDALSTINAGDSAVLEMLTTHLDEERTPSNVLYAAYKARGHLNPENTSLAMNELVGLDSYYFLNSIRSQDVPMKASSLKALETFVLGENLQPYETLMLIDVISNVEELKSLYPFTDFVIKKILDKDIYVSEVAEEAFSRIVVKDPRTISLIVSNLLITAGEPQSHKFFSSLMIVDSVNFTDQNRAEIYRSFLQLRNVLDAFQTERWMNLFRHSRAMNKELSEYLKELLIENNLYYKGKNDREAVRVRNAALLVLADFKLIESEHLIVIADVLLNSTSNSARVAGVQAYGVLPLELRTRKDNLKMLQPFLAKDHPYSPVNVFEFGAIIVSPESPHTTVQKEVIDVLTGIPVEDLTDFVPLLKGLVDHGNKYPYLVKPYIDQVHALLKMIK